jgi:hypothetical protein
LRQIGLGRSIEAKAGSTETDIRGHDHGTGS